MNLSTPFPANKNVTENTYPLRLNISFELSPAVEEKVVSANHKLVNLGYKEINFQPDGGAIPHVTLLMGDVASRADFERLQQILVAFAKREKSIHYVVQRPYLKLPSKSFIFVDVEPAETFRLLRHRLFEQVNQLLAFEYHGGPDNVSHITLGYARPSLASVGKISQEFESDLNGIASALALSRVGNRGACIEKFAVFRFAEG